MTPTRAPVMSVALLLALLRDIAVIVFVVAYVIHIW
jgi:uncharacterized membrane protein